MKIMVSYCLLLLDSLFLPLSAFCFVMKSLSPPSMIFFYIYCICIFIELNLNLIFIYFFCIDLNKLCYDFTCIHSGLCSINENDETQCDCIETGYIGERCDKCQLMFCFVFSNIYF
jgi:hypothetical protein